MYDVSVIKCEAYEEACAREALGAAIDAVGGLDWVEKGMKIVIKANLVSFMPPEKAATTHPVLLCGALSSFSSGRVGKTLRRAEPYVVCKGIVR